MDELDDLSCFRVLIMLNSASFSKIMPKFILTLLVMATAPLVAKETPLQEAIATAQKGDIAGAKTKLSKLADKGDAGAMNALGELIMTKPAEKGALEEAVKWFEKAAEANHAPAQFNLGRLLVASPKGMKPDPERGEFLIKAAAEAGHPAAQFVTGARLELKLIGDGKGPQPDLSEVRKWYEKAAEGKNGDALLALARFADGGIGIEASAEKGTDLTYQATVAGNLVAMNEMGVRYQRGQGIRKDNVAAVGWFLAAAEAGLPSAMVNLGNCYETGNGVPKNYDRAGSHYASAAKSGFPMGQFCLARLFEEGHGTKQNLTFAYVNYFRAAAGGVTAAVEKRDAIKAKLSADELKEAEKLLKSGEAQ